jgi:hypothetical protein
MHGWQRAGGRVSGQTQEILLALAIPGAVIVTIVLGLWSGRRG